MEERELVCKGGFGGLGCVHVCVGGGTFANVPPCCGHLVS
jgi:hypothetical protein